MRSKFLKTFLASLVLGTSLSANSGVMLSAPESVAVGDSFDVAVSFDVVPDLDLLFGEFVSSFEFTVTNLFGLSFLGASIESPFEAPLIPAGDPAIVSGLSFLGSTLDPLALATLSFSADAAGAAGGSVASLDGLFPQGVFVFGRFEPLAIEGDFRLMITEATVPVPASLGLMIAGLLLLRRRI